MIHPPKADKPRTVRCPECGGSGSIKDEFAEADGDVEYATMTCSDCDGTGEIEVEDNG